MPQRDALWNVMICPYIWPVCTCFRFTSNLHFPFTWRFLVTVRCKCYRWKGAIRSGCLATQLKGITRLCFWPERDTYASIRWLPIKSEKGSQRWTFPHLKHPKRNGGRKTRVVSDKHIEVVGYKQNLCEGLWGDISDSFLFYRLRKPQPFTTSAHQKKLKTHNAER